MPNQKKKKTPLYLLVGDTNRKGQTYIPEEISMWMMTGLEPEL